MKQRVKQIIGIGGGVGLAVGVQQASPIAVSSLHDLGKLPFLSFAAISFVILLTIFLMIAFLSLTAVFLSWFKRAQKWSEQTWTAVLFGFLSASWGYIFCLKKFAFVLKTPIAKIIFLVLAAAGGLVIGAIVYTSQKGAGHLPILKQAIEVFSKWVPRLVCAAILILTIFLFSHTIMTWRQGGIGIALKGPSEEKSKKPNIVLITSDALRADAFNEDLMPNLTDFAKKGIVFPRAYTPSPWTQPSFVSMFSGQDPSVLGCSVDTFSKKETVRFYNFHEDVSTLAEELQNLGYLTQAVVTNPNLANKRGFGQGFDGFIALDNIKPYQWHFHIKNMAIVNFVQRIPWFGNQLKPICDFLVGKSAPQAWKGTDLVADIGTGWLGKQPQKPFFLWLHFIDPHAPYDPVSKFSPDLEILATSEQEQFLRTEHLVFAGEVRWRPEGQKAFRELYNGEVRFVDEQVARIWRYLEKLALLDETIIIFTNDHGEEFFEHDEISHGKTLYNELVKAPLIVWLPDKKEIEEEIRNRPVSTADLKPTLLKLIGEKTDNERDWLDANYNEFLFIEANHEGPELKAAVWQDWKLIWDTFADKVFLYDLKEDTGEKEDLSKKYPKTTTRLKTFLKERVAENKTLYEKMQEQEGFREVKDFGEVVGY